MSTREAGNLLDRPDYWEHVAAVADMVAELPPEERAIGHRLARRAYALWCIVQAISEGRALAGEVYRQTVLEGLEELRGEAEAAYRAWREPRGIPAIW